MSDQKKLTKDLASLLAEAPIEGEEMGLKDREENIAKIIVPPLFQQAMDAISRSIGVPPDTLTRTVIEGLISSYVEEGLSSLVAQKETPTMSRGASGEAMNSIFDLQDFVKAGGQGNSLPDISELTNKISGISELVDRVEEIQRNANKLSTTNLKKE